MKQVDKDDLLSQYTKYETSYESFYRLTGIFGLYEITPRATSFGDYYTLRKLLYIEPTNRALGAKAYIYTELCGWKLLFQSNIKPLEMPLEDALLLVELDKL